MLVSQLGIPIRFLKALLEDVSPDRDFVCLWSLNTTKLQRNSQRVLHASVPTYFLSQRCRFEKKAAACTCVDSGVGAACAGKQVALEPALGAEHLGHVGHLQNEEAPGMTGRCT